MPTLSVFFGIVIRMYYDDHAPPHFHAIYGEFEALIGLDPLEVIDGSLPRRALSLVLDWANYTPRNCARIGTGDSATLKFSRFSPWSNRCTA